MPKDIASQKAAPRMKSARADRRSPAEKKKAATIYEPPLLTKFDKLEKLIVCGE